MVSRTMLNLYRTAEVDNSIARTMGTSQQLSTLVFLTNRVDVPETAPVNRQHPLDLGNVEAGDAATVAAAETPIAATHLSPPS